MCFQRSLPLIAHLYILRGRRCKSLKSSRSKWYRMYRKLLMYKEQEIVLNLLMQVWLSNWNDAQAEYPQYICALGVPIWTRQLMSDKQVCAPNWVERSDKTELLFILTWIVSKPSVHIISEWSNRALEAAWSISKGNIILGCSKCGLDSANAGGKGRADGVFGAIDV